MSSVSAQTPTPPAVEPASLSGIITNAVTGAPVQRAHVTIRSYDHASKQVYGAATTSEGKFIMTQLPPGHYTAGVERVGFTMPPNQAASVTDVILNPGDKKENFKLTLVPTGSISGHVFDAVGEPMQGVSVIAERGLGFERGTTDDKGQFRIGGLYPGKYRVKATPQADQFIEVPLETRTDGSADVHYSPTYYPESLARNQAARIDIQPAVELSGIDIRLVRTPIVSVSGRVFGLPAGANPGIRADGDGSRAVTTVKPDGTFVFWRLDPGRYKLFVILRGLGPQSILQSSPVEFEVAGVNLEHVDVRVMPPIDIPMQLHFVDDVAAPPAQPEQPARPAPRHSVTLSPAAPGPTSFEPSASDIGSDDTAIVEKVPPDIYHVMIMGRPAVYVKSVRVGSVETQGDILDVRNGLGGPVALSISSNTCQVHGTVSDRSGPIAGARVLLQPAENIGAHGYLAKTAADGTYMIPDVTPGRYKLLVVDDDALAAFQRGLDLEDYQDAAESLDLQPGDKIVKDLAQRK
jgi:hypothetical protein